MKTVVSNIIALFFSNYGELDLLQELLYVTYALRCQARERVIYREVACPFSCTTVSFRGRFRGGDLVICHPLFSDMTLQNQILVIESLFLTSVSKFIRKYLLSRQFSYMYSSCSNPATSLNKFSEIFFRKNDR